MHQNLDIEQGTRPRMRLWCAESGKHCFNHDDHPTKCHRSTTCRPRSPKYFDFPAFLYSTRKTTSEDWNLEPLCANRKIRPEFTARLKRAVNSGRISAKHVLVCLCQERPAHVRDERSCVRRHRQERNLDPKMMSFGLALEDKIKNPHLREHLRCVLQTPRAIPSTIHAHHARCPC